MFYRDWNSETKILLIPLLLSTSLLKKAAIVFHMAHDKITLFDKEIILYFSTSGHYYIHIYPTKTEKENCEEVLILEKNSANKERKSQIIKIHSQYRHTLVDNIKRLIM